MSKKNIPVAIARVSVLYVQPTSVAATQCPHCNELNFEEVWKEQKNKHILHCCLRCGLDYYMNVPNFSPPK